MRIVNTVFSKPTGTPENPLQAEDTPIQKVLLTAAEVEAFKSDPMCNTRLFVKSLEEHGKEWLVLGGIKELVVCGLSHKIKPLPKPEILHK